MSSNFDCVHLRADAHFELRLSRDVYWVPVNRLGGTRYTNDQIQQMVRLSPQEKRDRISTLYEAVQLFLLSRFHQMSDVKLVREGERLWEFHKPGYYAVLTNEGCCSSDASWLRYLLDGKYEKMGYFSFSRPTGSGHVCNYFVHDGWYYLYDLTPFTDQNVHTALAETGQRRDYLSCKFVSGILIKCKRLEDYAHYFARIQMTRGYDHLFFDNPEQEMPPIAVERNQGVITICYPQTSAVSPVLYHETATIEWKKVSPPMARTTWLPDGRKGNGKKGNI